MTSRPTIAMPQPEPENCWRPDARPLTEMKILIVDDDPANVELLQAILADAGFRCTKSVTDSRCTMDVTKDLQPDLVLLDLTMPHVDGFTVIDSLRGADGDLVLPIIVLTGDWDTKDKAACPPGWCHRFPDQTVRPGGSAGTRHEFTQEPPTISAGGRSTRRVGIGARKRLEAAR